MAVRNFYVEGHIDGRKTDLTGGPINSEGGMNLYVTQRDNGSIRNAFTIRSFTSMNNKQLITRVFDGSGNMVGELITDR